MFIIKPKRSYNKLAFERNVSNEQVSCTMLIPVKRMRKIESTYNSIITEKRETT